jgi:outer membrane lipoprotein LolB
MSSTPRWIEAIGCATIAVSIVLASCTSVRPRLAPAPWPQRLADLQRTNTWQLDGRAAVALGQQGWQASLDWRQQGDASEVHLAGPFGVGALELKLTPDGLSLNGAPPSEAVVAQLQNRLGFDLPLEQLRYWLLGIPDPSSTFELTRNAQDRAMHLAQLGWSIDYDRYVPNNGDVMPAHLVLSRADARVRIAVDRWTWSK